jgi:AcrR family transcriptional regulator
MEFPQRPRSRNGAGMPAVTPDQIIEAAVRLTAEQGLENWTLRQLAAVIEASPAVVYHHVGDREAVVAMVLDRVVRQMPLPPETLPWREWYSLLLDEHRVMLRKYPGTAYRLAMQGAPAAAAAPTIDLGIRLLQEAGFGDESVLACTVLMTTAYQYIAIEDEAAKILDVRYDNAQLYMSYQGRTDLPGLAAMGKYIHDLTYDPERLPKFFDELFSYAIQRCLDGMEHRLWLIGGMAP